MGSIGVGGLGIWKIVATSILIDVESWMDARLLRGSKTANGVASFNESAYTGNQFPNPSSGG
jgi:hypothetical protein